METDDTILFIVVDDEGPRRAGSGSLRRMLLKPLIQRLDPAVEVAGVVSRGERFRVPESGQLFRSRSTHEFDDGCLRLCGAIERRHERLPRIVV